MCEKCTPFKIHETHLAKDIQAFQKKLNPAFLKGKTKKATTN